MAHCIDKARSASVSGKLNGVMCTSESLSTFARTSLPTRWWGVAAPSRWLARWASKPSVPLTASRDPWSASSRGRATDCSTPLSPSSSAPPSRLLKNPVL
jgi:hypothetical protein